MIVRTRRPLIGVSLKMYLDHEETLRWAQGVAEIAAEHPALVAQDVSLVVFPSFPSLLPVAELLGAAGVAVGAQDMFWEDAGPFTSAVSGVALSQVGCSYVEIGHAERRQYFGETDDTVAWKVTAAVRNGLVPLICVGEPEQGSAEQAARACIAQAEAAIAQTLPEELVIAYEPEWAIGAVRPAPESHVHIIGSELRRWLDGRGLTSSRVLYGGSAGPGSLTTLAGTVDGLFLGRYAHDVAMLAQILDEVVAAQPRRIA